ncbi:MAG: SDR family oxidoreductase [Sphingomonadaceae bacterium]|nr:SDR family oxidoreductase [Sphingomonadaceae bacterium]
MTNFKRRKTLITGAAGGMGRACAQLFGGTNDLLLTDVKEGQLQEFAEELRGGGHIVTAHAGDAADADHLARLASELKGDQPFSVIHTAGLSPALGDWQSIMNVNLVGSELLMNALDPVLVAGSVIVPIASMAGHMMPAMEDVDALLVNPLGDGFMDSIGATIEALGGANSPAGIGGTSYSLSKRGVLLLTMRKAAEWGARGVRVVSISPGVIHTPMGLRENENTPGALDSLNASSIGRIGTPMDIAMAARFLCSEEASYITGSDLRVDGGATSVVTMPSIVGG